MDLFKFIDLTNEFGPSVVMFGFGVWGIYKLILLLIIFVKKSNKKVELAESKKDATTDLLITVLMRALDQRDVSKQKQHDEAANYRKEVIRKCDNYAREIMEETGASQVAIYDYCNGTQSLSGIPFLHFRSIAEKEDTKMRKTMYNERLDIGTLGTFLLDLEKELIIIIKNIKKEESKYPELSHFLLLNKKYKGAFANLVGTNSSLGFISITFDHNKKVDYDKVEKILFTYSHKVSNLLDYLNINR